MFYQLRLGHEYKVECLVNHLEQAGFEMLFDRWADRRGKELTDFVEKLEAADFVLVVGTELYLKKYEKHARDEKEGACGASGSTAD